MFIKIPFESEIPFKTNISEITKMSLEHDFNVNDEVVLGNFYISGEYRSHEVSVNTDSFNFTLPFSVTYRDDLIKETLEFNVEDFTYEIINNNSLKIYVEYSLKGDIKEPELFERVNEMELESELAYIDNFLENDGEIILEEEKKEDNLMEKEEVNDEKEEDNIKIITEKEKKEEKSKEDSRLSEKEEKTIMETIKDSDDTFVTYHIHVVKESETLENICVNYGVNVNYISEYNDIDNITVGEKILIPKIDE